jgi:oligopeptidase A
MNLIMDNNPLLSDAPHPRFAAITPDDVLPAVAIAIARHREAIQAIKNSANVDFEHIYCAKERADVRLQWVWGPVQHLEAVANSPALRAVFQEGKALITAYQTSVAQDPELFRRLEAIEHRDETLSSAERRAVVLATRAFRLSGVALPDADKARLSELRVQLGRLSSAFSNAVLDATEHWRRDIVEEAQLSGLPPAERAILRRNAEAAGQDGWLITLHAPSVQAIMTYADDRALRQDVYAAFQTRASDQGPDAGLFDNSERIAEILALRREASRLLGFENHAQRSLSVKMAADVDTADSFLVDLAARARGRGEAEIKALRGFAGDLGIADLQPWDVAYASEKLRQRDYAIDQSELRSYFPLATVLRGLFALITSLYDVEVVEQTGIETWHPDVRYFALQRAGARVAGFYFDSFARQGKRSGAWMNVCRPRLARADGAVTPIATVNCNFAPPSDARPALLTHTEVATLFHEMGHCLHHLLGEVELPSIGGISGFEWDAVEWPSQLMESFAWEPHVLASISAHAETGEPLPDALIERLGRARIFQSGIALLRQIELSLFDLRLHLVAAPDRDTANRVLDQIRADFAVIRPPAWTRFPCAFTHIFSGSYAAGYFSYLWAERLSADSFERFIAGGAIDPAAGALFRREVLAVGASRPALDSFVAFRGRAPENAPLLRQRGLVTA